MVLLLEKAIDFVSGNDPQKVGVGLAMLETVALGSQEEYALIALEVIFDQIAINHNFPVSVARRNLHQINRSFEQARIKRNRSLKKTATRLVRCKIGGRRKSARLLSITSTFRYPQLVGPEYVRPALWNLAGTLKVGAFTATRRSSLQPTHSRRLVPH